VKTLTGADREALRKVSEGLDIAAERMARIVVDTGAPDDLREFVKKQWIRLAKLQVAFEERLESPSSGNEPEKP